MASEQSAQTISSSVSRPVYNPISSQASLADITKENAELGSRLLLRYLTTEMTWRDYRTLADFLCCYGYEIKQDYSKFSAQDRELIAYLLNNTSLDLLHIYHKIIFLKDCNNGYKTKAIELLLASDSSQMPA